jgi:hypothetical protein
VQTQTDAQKLEMLDEITRLSGTSMPAAKMLERVVHQHIEHILDKFYLALGQYPQVKPLLYDKIDILKKVKNNTGLDFQKYVWMKIIFNIVSVLGAPMIVTQSHQSFTFWPTQASWRIFTQACFKNVAITRIFL